MTDTEVQVEQRETYPWGAPVPDGTWKRLRPHIPFVHPVLFALFPILSFLSANQNRLVPSDGTLRWLLLLNFAVAGLIWGVAALVLRDVRRGTLVASPVLLLFVVYGFIVDPLPEFGLNLVKFGPDKIVGVLLLAIAIGIFVLVRRTTAARVRRISAIASAVAVALVLVSGFSIVQYELSRPWSGTAHAATAAGAQTRALPASTDRPDVYYIVLDAYPRQDIVRNILHYDNSWFIDGLRKRGFYVANRANSNYAHTFLSLPSTLNMRYMDGVAKRMGDNSRDTTLAREMILNNEAVRVWKSIGYKYVNIGSGWFQTAQNPNADFSLNSSYASLKVGPASVTVNETAIVYLQNTALRPVVAPRISRSLQEKVLGAFFALKWVPSIREPTFTFAHVTIPHPPILFDADGKWVDGAALEAAGDVYRDVEHFVGQLEYASKRALDVIDAIVAKSSRPPIIVLAGDHGSPTQLRHPNNWTTPQEEGRSAIQERMGNLNAYFFPDRNYSRLYPSITPVNSFRLIFNQYFGLNYDLLPDRSYFSNYKQFFKLYDVTSWVK